MQEAAPKMTTSTKKRQEAAPNKMLFRKRLLQKTVCSKKVCSPTRLLRKGRSQKVCSTQNISTKGLLQKCLLQERLLLKRLLRKKVCPAFARRQTKRRPRSRAATPAPPRHEKQLGEGAATGLHSIRTASRTRRHQKGPGQNTASLY